MRFLSPNSKAEGKRLFMNELGPDVGKSFSITKLSTVDVPKPTRGPTSGINASPLDTKRRTIFPLVRVRAAHLRLPPTVESQFYEAGGLSICHISASMRAKSAVILDRSFE